jgi:mevalonate pyrophosphate decarboxylase
MTWLESWEMHSLFHTSSPPFTYWKPDSLALLEWLKPFVESKAAPIVTMDAGPNVHLIVPSAQAAEWRARVSAAFPRVEILSDPQGVGVSDV